MADPATKTKTPEPVAAAPAPVPEAPPVIVPDWRNAEKAALDERAAFTENNPTYSGVVALPGGRLTRVQQFAGARYTAQKQSRLLGEPEAMLTDEWRAEHPRFKYEWPIADNDETRSMLRMSQYVAVPPDAIRKDVSWAVIADALTLQGTAVAWRRHILVGVPPAIWYQRHLADEDFAMERTANSVSNERDRINEELGRSGYRAVVDRNEQNVEPILDRQE